MDEVEDLESPNEEEEIVEEQAEEVEDAFASPPLAVCGDWSAWIDDDDGSIYYFNNVTNESSWDVPDGWNIAVPTPPDDQRPESEPEPISEPEPEPLPKTKKKAQRRIIKEEPKVEPKKKITETEPKTKQRRSIKKYSAVKTAPSDLRKMMKMGEEAAVDHYNNNIVDFDKYTSKRDEILYQRELEVKRLMEKKALIQKQRAEQQESERIAVQKRIRAQKQEHMRIKRALSNTTLSSLKKANIDVQEAAIESKHAKEMWNQRSIEAARRHKEKMAASSRAAAERKRKLTEERELAVKAQIEERKRLKQLAKERRERERLAVRQRIDVERGIKARTVPRSKSAASGLFLHNRAAPIDSKPVYVPERKTPTPEIQAEEEFDEKEEKKTPTQEFIESITSDGQDCFVTIGNFEKTLSASILSKLKSGVQRFSELTFVLPDGKSFQCKFQMASVKQLESVIENGE